jgi:hypothetical protein
MRINRIAVATIVAFSIAAAAPIVAAQGQSPARTPTTTFTSAPATTFTSTQTSTPATTLISGQTSTQTRTPTGALTVPVSGTGGGGTFAGTLQIQKFAPQNGQVAALGLLSGTVTTGNGIATSIVKTVSLPTAVTGGTCDALNLDLGPSSVDLAGLQVALSRVVLDLNAQSMTAQSTAGTLLCGVAATMNNPSGLATGLNSIIDLIR